MKVRFIVNPAAGTLIGRPVERVTKAVREVLSAVKGRFEIAAPSSGIGAEVLSREARELGYDAVFACGGDGTVAAVATPLVGSDTALGIVPMGSGNGLALSLGIPEGVREAVALAREQRTTRIDTGTVADRYFFSTSGAGLDAVLARSYNTGEISRSVRGIIPYLPISLREFLRYDPETITIVSGNSTISIAPLLLTVANTPRYGGNAVVAPGAVPDDGLLDVVVVPRTGLISALRLGRRLLRGDIESAPGYRCFRTVSMEVLRTGASYVHADGEPFEWGGPLKFGIIPRSLKVIVPSGG